MNYLPVSHVLECPHFSLSLHLENLLHLQGVLAVSGGVCLPHVLLYQLEHLRLLLHRHQVTVQAVIMAVYWVFLLVPFMEHFQGYLDVTQGLHTTTSNIHLTVHMSSHIYIYYTTPFLYISNYTHHTIHMYHIGLQFFFIFCSFELLHSNI